MRPMLSKRAGIRLFLVLAAALGIAALLVPRTPQSLSYHHFADRRTWLGMPNFGDVASNIVFLVTGLWGLAFLSRKSSQARFIDPRERWPYVFIFLGLLLTACGSAYYHLAPDNTRLVWDRLPMTVVFMPLVAALIGERINLKLGLWLLPVLMAVGIGSVLQWHWSEQNGVGDLRFYAVVQLYALLALLAASLLPSRYTRLGSAHGSRFVPDRKGLRSSGQADFLSGTRRKRAHTQALGVRRRGILDFKNASEAPTHRGSLNPMNDAARDDAGHRSALKAPPVEG